MVYLNKIYMGTQQLEVEADEWQGKQGYKPHSFNRRLCLLLGVNQLDQLLDTA